MRKLLLFVLLITVGFGVLYLSMGADPLFPTPKQPAANPKAAPAQVNTPLVSVDRDGTDIKITVRKKVDFRSSRNRTLPDGRRVKILRYWLRSQRATPRRAGHYNLAKARIIFYEDNYPARQILVIHAKNMVIETFAGEEGFRPKENQKMLLHGVTMTSGKAFRDGTFKLTTAQLVANIQDEGITFSTPTPEMPYQIQGRLSRGSFDLRGKGIESVLPPLAREEEKNGGRAPTLVRFKGLSENGGTWRGDPKAPDSLRFRFSCQGNLVLERLAETDEPTITLADRVRIKRLGDQAKGFIRTRKLTLGLYPLATPGAKGSRTGGIRRLHAVGPRTTLGTDLGEIRAREIHARLDRTGQLETLRAQGIQRLFGTREGNRFEAKGFGSLRIVGFLGRPVPILGLVPALAWSGRLPGHLVTLEGRGDIVLPDRRGRASTLSADRGARLLFNREGKLTRVLGRGPCRGDTPDYIARSDGGFLLTAPVHAPERKIVTMGPPAGHPPVRFTLQRKTNEKNPEPLLLEGIGGLSQEITQPPGQRQGRGRPQRLWIEATASGHNPFMRFTGKVGADTLSITRLGRIVFERIGTATTINASPLHDQVNIRLQDRRLAAWCDDLDVRVEGDRGRAFCRGGASGPTLVVTRLDEGQGKGKGESRPRPPVHLLTPTLEIAFREGKGKEPVLKALGGFRLRSSGRDLLSLAGMTGGSGTAPPTPPPPLPIELEDDGPPDRLHVSGRELHMEREPGQETRIVNMYYDIRLNALADGNRIQGQGNRLWTAPDRGHLVMIGEPASVGVAEPGGKRNLTVISEVLELSRRQGEMTLVAGLLSSGIGGQVLIESNKDFFGRGQAKGSWIRASCGTPIHITRDRMLFTGITTLSQAVKDEKGRYRNLGRGPVLVCGRMECRTGDGGAGVFDEIVAERGFKLKVSDRGATALAGRGRELRFRASTGVMTMSGQEEPCQMNLGDMAIKGSNILFNIYDYSWAVRRISGNRIVPADHRNGTGKTGKK